MTSALALYALLGLPEPWRPCSTRLPLVIYGGASTIGAFAVKLAQRSNIHPIIAVAGRGISFVETLIDQSKGDTVIDYRLGDDAVVSGIQHALTAAGLKGTPLMHAYDAACVGSTFVNLSKVMGDGGKIVLVNPEVDTSAIPKNISKVMVNCGEVHGPDSSRQVFGYVYFQYFAKGLAEGWLRGHPIKVAPGGLDGLQSALIDLKEGKVSAVKYVLRIAETRSS